MDDERISPSAGSGAEPPWELPASIAAAWGLRERPHKGPKPGLSLKRVVEAAVRVAELEGLASVSMSRVATELGASTMALYRYVSAKDELLDLMVDAAAGTPPAASPDDGWREGLSRWAWGMRAMYYRSPWVLRIPIRGLPITPNQVAWFENGLSCMAATGLTEDEKASSVLLVSNYTRSEAMMGADLGAAVQASGTSPDEWITYYGRLLTTLADPQRYPAIGKLVAEGVFNMADAPEKEFSFGLERVLDGIEVLVRSRTAG